MDGRVPTMPSHFNFVGETDLGARHFENKDPYSKAAIPTASNLTTKVPKALANPLTVPVADGVNGAAQNAHDSATEKQGVTKEVKHG